MANLTMKMEIHLQKMCTKCLKNEVRVNPNCEVKVIIIERKYTKKLITGKSLTNQLNTKCIFVFTTIRCHKKVAQNYVFISRFCVQLILYFWPLIQLFRQNI